MILLGSDGTEYPKPAGSHSDTPELVKSPYKEQSRISKGAKNF